MVANGNTKKMFLEKLRHETWPIGDDVLPVYRGSYLVLKRSAWVQYIYTPNVYGSFTGATIAAIYP